MSEDFSRQVVDALKARFRFKLDKGKWLQGGRCPQCDKHELFCAAADPKMVKCGRIENCGWESSVRDELPDLFEDWSKRFPAREEAPNAAAEAYLRELRGLDLAGLRGAFVQETYADSKTGASTATVRFALPNETWWERLIDRPGRFGKKARFKFGGQWGGHWWAHPLDTLQQLAAVDEIWLAEGIFDACAVRQNFDRICPIGPDPDWSLTEDKKPARRKDPMRTAVSLMSVNNYPEAALDALRKAIAEGPTPKHRPRLIFAFDVGKAGVEYTKKFVKRARKEGWDATAAQVRPDGEGTKLDWNDLHLRHRDWNGDPDRAPFARTMIEEYLWNGAVTIAETALIKAELIRQHRKLNSFDFRFDNRIYWARWQKKDDADDPAGGNLIVEEIANCAFRILYLERDEATDDANYFIRIDFPNATPSAKARFSSSCCAASGEFKKRLFAFSGMWMGSQEQLDRLMRSQTRTLKMVEPIHFTGYSAPHKAWVLGDIAVRGGHLLEMNAENCFDFGKQSVKLRTPERMLTIHYDADQINLSWARELWAAWGVKGLATLAFFTLSLFAVQIRDVHKSLGFLEIWGEAGSGKTTLVEFCWKLFGRTGYEGFDPNKATNAGLARNFMKVSNLPVGLIESGRDQDKASHGRQFDWAELLTLFNGRSPRVTGVKSSGSETFEPPFLGSIYLMQNNPVDAMPAVLERIMSFPIDKSEWTERTGKAARLIERWDAEAASAWIIHVIRKEAAFLDFFFERFEFHEKDMARRCPDLHNARILKCHAQLAAGVEVLGKLIPEEFLPESALTKTLAFIDRIALERQLTSGADHPIVTRFWDIVDHIIAREQNGQQDEGRGLNLSRKPDELIAINLVQFEQRARSLQLIPPSDAELKKHLRGSKSRKFVAAKPVNTPCGGSVHCWVFQQPVAQSARSIV